MKKLISYLGSGSASGKPFNRMQPWEAFLGGLSLFVTAFAVLFLTI